MSDLAAFLLARIGEDEAASRVGPEPSDWCDRGEGVHYEHARVLGECEAKRQIVTGYYELIDSGRTEQEQTLRWTCELLALPYATHADYREEWRP